METNLLELLRTRYLQVVLDNAAMAMQFCMEAETWPVYLSWVNDSKDMSDEFLNTPELRAKFAVAVAFLNRMVKEIDSYEIEIRG